MRVLSRVRGWVLSCWRPRERLRQDDLRLRQSALQQQLDLYQAKYPNDIPMGYRKILKYANHQELLKHYGYDSARLISCYTSAAFKKLLYSGVSGASYSADDGQKAQAYRLMQAIVRNRCEAKFPTQQVPQGRLPDIIRGVIMGVLEVAVETLFDEAPTEGLLNAIPSQGA